MEPSRQDNGGQEVATARRRQLFGRTVVQAFRAELDQLVNSFERENTKCYYVRCLKPNQALQPEKFDGGSVLRQCRYSGLLETVQIRQHGYPHRRPILDFLQRYSSAFWPQELALQMPFVPEDLGDMHPADQMAWVFSIITKAIS